MVTTHKWAAEIVAYLNGGQVQARFRDIGPKWLVMLPDEGVAVFDDSNAEFRIVAQRAEDGNEKAEAAIHVAMGVEPGGGSNEHGAWVGILVGLRLTLDGRFSLDDLKLIVSTWEGALHV